MSLMFFDQSRNDHFICENTRFLHAEASLLRKNSRFSYSRAFISPGMTILFVKIGGFWMQRLVFYVKTRGFRTVEPFGGVQWGSVWLLFGVLVRENTRFLCAEASFLRKNTRFSHSGAFGGSNGALLGCCLLSFGSLWGPA